MGIRNLARNQNGREAVKILTFKNSLETAPFFAPFHHQAVKGKYQVLFFIPW